GFQPGWHQTAGADRARARGAHLAPRPAASAVAADRAGLVRDAARLPGKEEYAVPTSHAAVSAAGYSVLRTAYWVLSPALPCPWSYPLVSPSRIALDPSNDSARQFLPSVC